MKPRYELHFEGEVIHSKSLKELQAIARNTACHYEIYAYYRAAVPVGASSGNLKLRLCDIQEAARMVNKGFSKQVVAKKFRVNADYLMGILHKNQLV
jgi:hypothetical protein